MELVNYPMPVPTGTEVLMRMTYAGMCHSDLHLWEGYFDMGGGNKLPVNKASRDKPYTVGHELEGVIVAAGDEVPLESFNMQKSYAVFPWIGCDNPDECAHCAAGNMNFCKSPKTQKFCDGKSQYGGYASYILVPHHKYLLDYEGAVPTGLGGVYMCSGLTAYAALECAYGSNNPPQGADDLVIIGCGGLGFQGISMALGRNGAPPIAVDISTEKLAGAAKLGCKTFTSGSPDSIKQIKKLTKGNVGVGAVIDFVGNEKTFAFANSIVRGGGKIVVIGLMGGKLQLPIPMIPLGPRSIEGWLCGNLQQAKDMLEMLRGGQVPIVPHHFRSIFEVNDALQDLAQGNIVGRCVLKHDWAGPETSKM